MSTPTPDDLRWLAAAARMSRPFVGTTGRNPAVGAFVVDPGTGVVLGRGVTGPGGRPHAEPLALAVAGARSRGATLFVTLEPCHHTGKSPSCAEAVLAAGISRLVAWMPDPDSRTSSQSFSDLAAGGVEVVVGAPGAAPAWLHEGYLMRVLSGRPFVTAKLAVSADGKIGRRGTPKFSITGAAARRYSHTLRALSDAILVGAETARLDDPRLDVRLAGLQTRSPFRWVALGTKPAVPDLRLFSAPGAPVGVITPDPALARTLPDSVERLLVGTSAGGVDWDDALAGLGRRRVNNLLVEGGAAILYALLVARLIDRFHLLESKLTVGADGVQASPDGDIVTAIGASGLVAGQVRQLGRDQVTVFERRN